MKHLKLIGGLNPLTLFWPESPLPFSLHLPNSLLSLLHHPSIHPSSTLPLRRSSTSLHVSPPRAATDSEFTPKMKNRPMGTAAGGNMTKSTSIGGDMCSLEKTDGSQSDTAVSLVGTVDKKRRSSIGAKMAAVVGLSRKSRSASQLSQTGRSPIISVCFLFVSNSASFIFLLLSVCSSRPFNERTFLASALTT